MIPLGGVQAQGLLQELGRALCHTQFAIGIDCNLNVIPTTAIGTNTPTLARLFMVFALSSFISLTLITILGQ